MSLISEVYERTEAVRLMKSHLYTLTKGKDAQLWRTQNFSYWHWGGFKQQTALTPLSNNPSDLSVLNPAHFLTSDSLLQPAQPNYLEILEKNLCAMATSRQGLRQRPRQFWHRSQSEYLQELLQKRNKRAIQGREYRARHAGVHHRRLFTSATVDTEPGWRGISKVLLFYIIWFDVAIVPLFKSYVSRILFVKNWFF